MNNSQKMSRRDWFRLRKPQTNQTLGATPPNPPETLKEIEHPPNHDGMDLSLLPPMREALLSTEQVEALFTDIAGLASDVQLMQRANKAQRATAQAANTKEQLALAKTALVNGDVPRVQIRYRWEGSLWIDTLVNQESQGFKLVRITHESV